VVQRRGFGKLRRLPSKHYQASYVGPDGIRYTAPATFTARIDAEGWLASERRLVTDGTWTPPKLRDTHRRATTLGEYAESWLRRRDLKPRTRVHYQHMLDRFLLPAFGHLPLAAVTPRMVAEFHHDLASQTGPTYRSHAYSLLRAIYRTAIAEDEVPTSPCRIVGAGSSRRVKRIEPATLAELGALTLAMPERLRAMVLLQAWCALRFGEAAELRRKDVDLKNGVLHIRRAVVRADGQVIVSTPKSDAGTRDVDVPPHLLPMLRDHLTGHAAWGRDGLLFPGPDGTHLAHSSYLWQFARARTAAGRPDLRPHDLRHTAAVMAAQTGATLAELMARLGHSTPSAALIYQHAAAGRGKVIAQRLSDLASGDTSG